VREALKGLTEVEATRVEDQRTDRQLFFSININGIRSIVLFDLNLNIIKDAVNYILFPVIISSV
jgi:hypothetical protein